MRRGDSPCGCIIMRDAVAHVERYYKPAMRAGCAHGLRGKLDGGCSTPNSSTRSSMPLAQKRHPSIAITACRIVAASSSSAAAASRIEEGFYPIPRFRLEAGGDVIPEREVLTSRTLKQNAWVRRTRYGRLRRARNRSAVPR